VFAHLRDNGHVAWTQIGSTLGMFTDKVQLTHEYDHIAAAGRINYKIEALRQQERDPCRTADQARIAWSLGGHVVGCLVGA
jgi:hypothetical protein